MDTLRRQQPDALPFSSSPAFGTPLHPIPPTQAQRPPPPPAFKPTIPTLLPILLPPPTLRPLAFRTFTKKHNLTLNASALQALATFIGRHCGTGWREEGTGEKVLEEVAKLWKAESGAVIVEDGEKLKGILKVLEGCMSGGRIAVGVKGGGSRKSGLSRQSSFAFGNDSAVDLNDASHRPSLNDGHRHSSFGMSKLHVQEDEHEDEESESTKEPRHWLKVTSAFDQPRFSYDTDKKHFVPITTKPSNFPPASHKTALFRERYNIIHQRLLRNEAFQAPSFSTHKPAKSIAAAQQQQHYKITPISNLLGRGSSSHLLLGLLAIAPTGTLALNDPSGSISLDLQHATPLQGEDSSFFCPGMIVLVDGVYEENFSGAGASGLGGTGGVGGTIGGRFIGFSIGGPPVERRGVSLGVSLDAGAGGGFGWTDFTGLGSEKAVGSRMRRLEERVLLPGDMTPEDPGESQGNDRSRSNNRKKMIILSELPLDQPDTLTALRHVLSQYKEEQDAPIAFLLLGSFTSRPSLSNSGTGSIEYKELFNALAALLSEYPALLRNSTWIFVPGDNDPWASSWSAGASVCVPRQGVPEVLTSRVQRVFASANAEGERKRGIGQAVWTSNPARVTLFGSAQEIVVFRDDVSGRLRRNAVKVGGLLGKDAKEAAGQQGQDESQRPEDGSEDTLLMSSGALPTTEDIDMNIDPPQPANPEVESVMAVDPPQSPTPRTDETDTYGTLQAKKLILSLLPQSTLSPFPITLRPTHWDYTSSALSLYPLPHTLILADAEAEPFAMTFEGCHVINPGRLVGGKRKRVRWCEYDFVAKRGSVREGWMG